MFNISTLLFIWFDLRFFSDNLVDEDFLSVTNVIDSNWSSYEIVITEKFVKADSIQDIPNMCQFLLH